MKIEDTPHSLMNGEHTETEKSSKVIQKAVGGETIEKHAVEEKNDRDRVIPMHTNEYAQLLSSWPKVKLSSL